MMKQRLAITNPTGSVARALIGADTGLFGPMPRRSRTT